MNNNVDLPKIQLTDLFTLQEGLKDTEPNNMLINIRGCNGSGKSTIPMEFRDLDENSFEVLWTYEGRQKVVATVFPSFNFLALGKYSNKCGGLDGFKTTDEIRFAVEVLWNLNYNIIMEGIMASTVRQTYIDLFTRLQQEQDFKREIIVYNIVPTLETCLERIQLRNGGKVIKEEQVASKWRTVDNNVQHFHNAGFNSLRVTNEDIPKEDTLKWFFENISKNPISNLSTNKESEFHETHESQDFPVEPKSSLRGYEWYEWYKEPKGIVFNQKYRDIFWKFIYERLNIYNRRVILAKPAPWTSDEVLKKYRFTNISRDMDKLTIYERDHIMTKLDEKVTDIELRKKSVMFNIMLFRTFVKIESYEPFGFIDFSDTNWRTQWNKGKKVLLSRRERGIQNFTGSYMVNNLHACNPDESTRANKTLNALCLLEYVIDNLDEVYKKSMISSYNMKDQLEYLTTLNGVGGFTAYEYACSFAMAHRYFKNVLVPWTQDSYTNIGPGSKRGIEWIFKSRGNLTEIECILYLRSIWKSEMKRLGYYDDFVSKLPPELDNDLDLRIIEHCLCEMSKWAKINSKTGQIKQKFSPKTQNLKELLL